MALSFSLGAVLWEMMTEMCVMFEVVLPCFYWLRHVSRIMHTEIWHDTQLPIAPPSMPSVSDMLFIPGTLPHKVYALMFLKWGAIYQNVTFDLRFFTLWQNFRTMLQNF